MSGLLVRVTIEAGLRVETKRAGQVVNMVSAKEQGVGELVTQETIIASRELARRWLQKATNDLITARQTLLLPEGPIDTVAFHAQQAAEKALKALLTFNQRSAYQDKRFIGRGQRCNARGGECLLLALGDSEERTRGAHRPTRCAAFSVRSPSKAAAQERGRVRARIN